MKQSRKKGILAHVMHIFIHMGRHPTLKINFRSKSKLCPKFFTHNFKKKINIMKTKAFRLIGIMNFRRFLPNSH